MHTRSKNPEIDALNAELETACRPVLSRALALPDDPHADRASVSVAEDDPELRTMVVHWPEALHSEDERENIKAALLEALPPELAASRTWRVRLD